MKPFLLPLALLTLLCTPLLAFDTDGDGMDDDWEDTYGFDPNNAEDALQDLDGDRIPNAWECVRGTDPLDYYSAPDPDVVVWPGHSDPAQHIYESMAAVWEAVGNNALQLSERAIIWLNAGEYSIADLGGASPERSFLYLAEPTPEGVIIKPTSATDGLSIVGGGDTVFDGLIFDGLASGFATEIPAIQISSSAGTAAPNLRLVNCIIRRWGIDGSQQGIDLPGALLNDGGNVTLLHTTVSDCAGWREGAVGYSIDNLSGTVLLQNSIIWSRTGPASALRSAVVTDVALEASLVQGDVGASDPMLTLGGYLSNQSAACVGTGVPQAGDTMVYKSLTGWWRYTLDGSVDKGADHWYSFDADSLADWWEYYWFTGYTAAETDDPDGDTINNAAEYLAHSNPSGNPPGGTTPTSWTYTPYVITGSGTTLGVSGDSDTDGVTDTKETTYFGAGNLHRNGNHDADEDGAIDRVELMQITPNTQPLLWDSNDNHRRDIYPTNALGTGLVLIHTSFRAGTIAVP